MGTKPNDPATGYTMISPDGSNHLIETGLTKREHFASMAMQGWISALQMDRIGSGDMDKVISLAAQYSIGFADELIKQLNNPLNQQQ